MTNTTIQQHLKRPIGDLRQAYREGRLRPADVVEDIIRRADELEAHNIWIEPPSHALIDPYVNALSVDTLEDKPLWGIPFAIKDNIDLAHFPTTAACPAFTYQPERSAHVVARLIEAGGIPVGKTNLDQFATGLVGTRSPYGVCTHPDRPDLISGGSSSGSAIAVSCGLASFALGTDTAGSGRIPAAFNRLVGFKPTRGLLSISGVVPACRSIDCVSLLVNSVQDAASIGALAIDDDAEDPFALTNPYSNSPAHFGKWHGDLTLGVLSADHLEFFGDGAFADAYARTLQSLQQAGAKTIEIDFEPFQQAARQLYEGPWVAERYLATRPLIDEQPEALLDVTRKIISAGSTFAATDQLESQYKLAELRRVAMSALNRVDAMLTPTAGTHYSVSDLMEDPFGCNTNLGYYTNFMNLLDLCGVALPGVDTEDGHPFGICLVADRLEDTRLLAISQRVQDMLVPDKASEVGAYRDLRTIDIVVCGAHMSGLPLNWQLTQRGGKMISETQTSPCYRLFALAGGPPFRPGMIRDPERGHAIDVEVWRLPAPAFASFQEGIPWPLAIGKVELADGTTVSGFVCEPGGIEDAEEITHHGGWRGYMEHQN